MEHDTERNRERERSKTAELARRAVLRATGGMAALSLGAGTVAASNHRGGQGQSGSAPNDIDPVFGRPSAGPNPCFGSEGDGEHAVHPDCLDQFGTPIRPDHQVELHIGIPGLLLGVVEAGVLSDSQVTTLNTVVEDGTVTGGLSGTVPFPPGQTTPLAVVADALASTNGFHFDPAGLWVEPGDVVLFSGESPDHLVASFHERHGRQNRVPDETGLISSPLIPTEGYWLYKFRSEGVYDLYCAPHAAFGMVMRVVVWDGTGDPPAVEDSVDPVPPGAPLRPPAESNALPSVLGGLDPEVPPSHWTLEESDELAPENIVSADEGAVHWEDVVAEYRTEN